MSTFKGIIAEFPQIRVDYFRLHAEQRAPLACFLSHVHSDHLTGLESLRAPFVYCSAATREILLRLEKYHYRLNFAKGILESRNVTYNRSMHKLAKPLPLDTPTVIELAPGNSIRVTLIDANHCVGAVMFLFEGNGKAVLYTGDIRAETWWLNGLIRNPVLIPYSFGSRRLNCIYLDTTFATKSKPYQEFPSKAEGIRELLAKVGEYDDDTVFYFHSWTFGYEDVWIALSASLGSRIHLDAYRTRLYGSLSTLDKRQLKEVGLSVQSENKYVKESGLQIREGSALCGFRNGNHIHPGCLTSRESVRIHSCERGMGCRVMDNDKNSKIVHIIPIITRSDGMEIAELGAGGGKGDLDQKEELETGDVASIGKLMELCATTITDETLLSKILATLQQMMKTQTSEVSLNLHLQKPADTDQEDIPIHNLVSALSSTAHKEHPTLRPANRTIRFPYSRHSSYRELCALVAAFQPNDVFPCTVDEETWTPDMSMQSLFGDSCSRASFRHDAEMMELYRLRLKREDEKRKREESQQETQTTEEQAVSSPELVDVDQPIVAVRQPGVEVLDGTKDRPIAIDDGEVLESSAAVPLGSVGEASQSASTRRTRLMPSSAPPDTSSAPAKKRRKMTNQQIAYDAAIGAKLTWSDYGGLQSTRRREDRDEEEL